MSDSAATQTFDAPTLNATIAANATLAEMITFIWLGSSAGLERLLRPKRFLRGKHNSYRNCGGIADEPDSLAQAPGFLLIEWLDRHDKKIPLASNRSSTIDRCRFVGSSSPSDPACRTMHQENAMNWVAPIVEEICVGMEVTSYESADLDVLF